MFNLIVVNFICVRFLLYNKMLLSWIFIYFVNDFFEVFVIGCIILVFCGLNKIIFVCDVFGEFFYLVCVCYSFFF